MDFLSYIVRYKVSSDKKFPQNNITHVIITKSTTFNINVPRCRYKDFIQKINSISKNDLSEHSIKIYELVSII